MSQHRSDVDMASVWEFDRECAKLDNHLGVAQSKAVELTNVPLINDGKNNKNKNLAYRFCYMFAKSDAIVYTARGKIQRVKRLLGRDYNTQHRGIFAFVYLISNSS